MQEVIVCLQTSMKLVLLLWFYYEEKKVQSFQTVYFWFTLQGRLNLCGQHLYLPSNPQVPLLKIFLHADKLKINNNVKLSTNKRETLRCQNEERHTTLRKSHHSLRASWGMVTGPNKTMSHKQWVQDMRQGFLAKRDEEWD